jgi:hypothetical protein
MSIAFNDLLAAKRIRLRRLEFACEELRRDIGKLERVQESDIPEEVMSAVDWVGEARLSRQEKNDHRMEKVLTLFRIYGGQIRLEQLMRALNLSKNATKEWMNSPIDRDPASCPWERVLGSKSHFALRQDFVPTTGGRSQ